MAPDGQEIAIELTSDQWQLAVSVLETVDAIYQEIGDIESRDLGRDAIRAVRRGLG